MFVFFINQNSRLQLDLCMNIIIIIGLLFVFYKNLFQSGNANEFPMMAAIVVGLVVAESTQTQKNTRMMIHVCL